MKYIYLDTNIWLMLFSKNTPAIKRIKDLLLEEKTVVITTEILKIELLRNVSKLQRKSSLTEKEKNKVYEFIMPFFKKSQKSIYLSFDDRDFDSMHIKIERRKYINKPPYFSWKSDKKLTNNDSIVWIQLLDLFSKSKEMNELYLFTNDNDFVYSKDFLLDEWNEKCNKTKLTIDTLDIFNYYRNCLDWRGLDFDDCLSIFSEINDLIEFAPSEIPSWFIEYLLINNFNQHPTCFLVYGPNRNKYDPQSIALKFYCDLLSFVESGNYKQVYKEQNDVNVIKKMAKTKEYGDHKEIIEKLEK